MEKRRVTVSVGGQTCSFYSDDSDQYISALEQRANAALKQTAGFSGSSSYRNAILSVLLLTDQLMRKEQEEDGMPRVPEKTQKTEQKNRKSAAKAAGQDAGQVSVWELLNDREALKSRADG